MATKKLLWTILKSTIVIILSTVALFFITPIRRPFICNDLSLSHPKNDDTVSNLTIYLFGLSPILFIFISEVIFNWTKFTTILRRLIWSWDNTAYLYHKYLINFSLMHSLMFGAKLLTGSHRPHFFETCMPDTLKNCTTGTYVYDFNCTNTKSRQIWVNDSFMSFFSGHTIIGAYASFFLIFYFQYRMKKNRFLRSTIQMILALIAFFVGVSRVFDQRHWVTDVAVGGILGILLAIHSWLVQCKILNSEKVQNNRTEILPLTTR